MFAVSPQILLAVWFSAQMVRWCVWAGLVGLTIALLVLVRTSWGQSQPLRKCIVLSLIAHLLLGIYTTTVNIVTATGGPGDGQAMRVAYLGDESVSPEDGSRASEPWPAFIPGSVAEPGADALRTEPIANEDHRPERADPEPPKSPPIALPSSDVPAPIESRPATSVKPLKPSVRPAEPIDISPPERVEPEKSDVGPPENEPSGDLPSAKKTANDTPGKIDPSAISINEPGANDDPSALPKRPSAYDLGPRKPSSAAPIEPGDVSAAGNGSSAGGETAGGHDVPTLYQLRVSPDRSRVLAGHGGNQDTEAAVRSALKWLAANQSQNGRWDPRRFGGGREVMIDGQDRRGAGSQADTGITGLALLAFLAAGHTHAQGDHQQAVRHGLEYLLAVQAADGNLAGQATTYEKMYCHAMATFALSEGYAMTSDDRLQAAVRRAIGYTVAAQHPASGGWRYQPGDPGDTSQLGWQLMALKSAELGGIRMSEETRNGMVRFLKSVSSGKQGGLASYRPGHPVSRPMTAEALVCRQFLGMQRENPASDEAGNYLLGELPGAGQTNLYYWYYGTLAMYQLQGQHWERWNEALQTSLLRTQRAEGDLAGSWDPDAAWGAYGGRAYSTALSALCLEVYYRFLPLYVQAASRDRAAK